MLAESDQKLAELSTLQLQKYFDHKGLEKFNQLLHMLLELPLATYSSLGTMGIADFLSFFLFIRQMKYRTHCRIGMDGNGKL